MTEGLRNGLSKTVDVRAIETRRRLSEAYVKAVSMGDTEISVVGLCKLAGVGRSTFYAHFATIEDMGVSMIGDIFREMAPIDVERRTADSPDRAEVTRLGVEQLIESLWSVRVLLTGAIQAPGRAVIQQRLVEEVVETTRGTVIAEQPQLAAPEVEMATHFIAGGVVQLILMWLDTPQISRERLIENLLTLLPSWLANNSAQ